MSNDNLCASALHTTRYSPHGLIIKACNRAISELGVRQGGQVSDRHVSALTNYLLATQREWSEDFYSHRHSDVPNEEERLTFVVNRYFSQWA